MKLAIEIAVAARLVFCTVSGAAFAAEKTGGNADNLGCAFAVPDVVLAVRRRKKYRDTRTN
jgi:hypothetical protein